MPLFSSWDSYLHAIPFLFVSILNLSYTDQTNRQPVCVSTIQVMLLLGLMFVFGTPTVDGAPLLPVHPCHIQLTPLFPGVWTRKAKVLAPSSYSAVERRHQGNLHNHQLVCNLHTLSTVKSKLVGAFCSPIKHVNLLKSCQGTACLLLQLEIHE